MTTKSHGFAVSLLDVLSGIGTGIAGEALLA